MRPLDARYADLLRKQAELDQQRRELDEEQARRSSLAVEQRIAEYLHERMCTWSHEDQCNWFNEDWKSHRGSAHETYLNKALKLCEAVRDTADLMRLDDKSGWEEQAIKLFLKALYGS
jgi:hypothetical protein